MNNYIIVGGSELQKGFIEKVKENGLVAHVVDYNPNCVGSRVADHFHCLSIDDLKGILSLAEELNIIGISTVATEQGNVTANYVAEKLGLSCNGLEVALNTTDKSRMKQVLADNGIATPKSTAVRAEEELLNLSLDFPVIVKASDRSAGRGVALAYNQEELLHYYRESLSVSFNKIVLVEEYVDSKQYSIETISSKGSHEVVAVTEMGFSGPPFFVETQHKLPALLSLRQEEAFKDFALQALSAFKIQYGACHIEIRLKDEKPTMIEIASRMGGWRHWMIDAALSIDYLQLILDCSLGKHIKICKPTKERVAISQHIFGQEDYQRYQEKKEKGIQFVSDYVKQGRPKANATNLMETHGFYITVENR